MKMTIRETLKLQKHSFAMLAILTQHRVGDDELLLSVMKVHDTIQGMTERLLDHEMAERQKWLTEAKATSQKE